MPLSSGLEKAYNDQITLELASSYAYLAMSAWFEAESLPGFASWMRLQADEERAHAFKFIDFVLDRGGRVVPGGIEAPRADFDAPLEVFETALGHEQRVTAAINDLYAAALAERDFASLPLLDWFVNEQVEEEATVGQVIDDLRRVADDSQALLMLDRELGARSPEDEGD